MKYLLYSYLFLFNTLFLSAEAHAESNEKSSIKVVTEYIEPYQIKNADGSLGGFSTDVVNALFEKVGKQSEIYVMPWARAYEIAQREKEVMIFSIARSPRREPNFHWVGKLVTERLFFWGLKDVFPFQVDSVDLLRPYSIAASRHSNVAQYLHDHGFSKVRRLIREDQNMRMLFSKRIDLIVANEVSVRRRAENLGLDFNDLQKLIEVPELNNDLSVAFSLKTSPELVKEFQQAMTELEQEGVIEGFRQKWQIVF